MSQPRPIPEKFLVAFSFAGEQRDLVRPIAEAVEQRLGRGTVFFDEWFKHEIVSMNRSDLKLQDAYIEKTELIVVGISQAYADKEWTRMEWDAIRARHMTNPSDSNNNADRIWPLRVGDGDLPGLHTNTIWDDARKYTPKQIAARLIARLQKFVPDAGKPHVFLAECMSELEDEDKVVNRQGLKTFLEEDCDWSVLPHGSLLDSDQYGPLLEAELRKCQAFVQLLGRNPWKGGRFDRRQYDVARDRSLPIFRFRGEFDLAKLKETNLDHYQFVTMDVFGVLFDDFKVSLRAKLNDLTQERERAIREAQQEEKALGDGETWDDQNGVPPLVRVVVRAGNPRALWEEMFPLLDEKENVLYDELSPRNTLLEMQRNDPCQGFLILCDSAALNDERLAPRDDLAQCQQIQREILKLKNDHSQCPPVGLVYWKPPDPSWPWLLRSSPLKDRLHKVLGDALHELGPFFSQVRQVRRVVS